MKSFFYVTVYNFTSKHMRVKIDVYPNLTFWKVRFPNGKTETYQIDSDKLKVKTDNVFEHIWKYVPGETIEYEEYTKEIEDTLFV